MASNLISYLTGDLVAERLAARDRAMAEVRAVHERQIAEERATTERIVLIEAITDAVVVLFPDAPIGPVVALAQVQDAERLRATLRAVHRAADQQEVEAVLRAAVAAN